jgi:hypothetical protein
MSILTFCVPSSPEDRSMPKLSRMNTDPIYFKHNQFYPIITSLNGLRYFCVEICNNEFPSVAFISTLILADSRSRGRNGKIQCGNSAESRYDTKTQFKLPLFHEKHSIYLRHSYLPIPSILTFLYHAIKIFSAPKKPSYQSG